MHYREEEIYFESFLLVFGSGKKVLLELVEINTMLVLKFEDKETSGRRIQKWMPGFDCSLPPTSVEAM